MTTPLASAIAEEIWKLSLTDSFANLEDDDAIHQITLLIDSRVRPLVEALKDCHPANIWDKARMYYTDPDRAQAIHGQDISKWHKDRCDQVNAALANETPARKEEKPQSVIQQLWNDTPDDKERGVFPGDEIVQPAPRADEGATPETTAFVEQLKWRYSGAAIEVLYKAEDFASTLERQRDAFKAALDLCFSERDAAHADLAARDAVIEDAKVIIQCLLHSANPHPGHHPSMTEAWTKANAFLSTLAPQDGKEKA